MLGKLVVGGVSSPLIQANRTVTVAGVPPRVTDLSPARGATVESDLPLIYATLSDAGGTGIDPNATRLSVDGADVTGQATVDARVRQRTSRPSRSPPGGTPSACPSATGPATRQTTDWNFTVSTGKVIQGFSAVTPRRAAWRRAGTRAFPPDRPARRQGQRQRRQPRPKTCRWPRRSRASTPATYTVQPGENVSEGVPVTATFVGADGTKVNVFAQTRT